MKEERMRKDMKQVDLIKTNLFQKQKPSDKPKTPRSKCNHCQKTKTEETWKQKYIQADDFLSKKHSTKAERKLKNLKKNQHKKYRTIY